MNEQLYEAMHHHRAAQLERAATVAVLTRRVRRAKRLERYARWAGATADWSQRVAERLAARARASCAHLP